MSLEKQKFSELPKLISPETKTLKVISPKTKSLPEAQKVFTETKEKLKTISIREFFRIPE